MTAIALEEPFDDDYLRSLPPTLRRRAAMGLWHLAAAATSTVPEQAVLLAAEDVRNDLWVPGRVPNHAQQRLLRIAEALENDIAWHSDARFEVATAIARDLLTGPEAEANQADVFEQGTAWNELRLDLAVTDEDGDSSDLRSSTPPGSAPTTGQAAAGPPSGGPNGQSRWRTSRHG